MIEFDIQNDQGMDAKTNSSEAADFLRQQGINVTQLGQDELTAYVVGEDGQMQPHNLVDLMTQAGLDVRGARPMNANNEMFNPKYRFLTERLGNDEQKKQLLTMEMQQEGIADAQVIGSGDDWYAFDPKQGQYFALTNKPGLDMGDIEHGAEMVGKGVAGTLGAVGGLAAGSFSGPGAIAVGAAGAAGGAGLAEGGLQGLAAGISPAFREVQSLRGALAAGGEEALLAAPFGAIPGGATWAKAALPGLQAAGKGGSGLARALSATQKLNTIMGTGVASTAARGTGAVAQAGGALVGETAGAIANSPLAKSLATSFVPGLGQAQMAGIAMQAPKWINRTMARAPGFIGKQLENLGEQVPELAAPRAFTQGMQNWSNSVTRPLQQQGTRKLEQNLLKMNLRARGMSEEEIAKRFAEPASEDILANVARKTAVRFAPEEKMLAWGRNSQQIGRSLGRGMDAMSRVGQGIEAGAENVLGAGLRGAEAIGKGAKYGGQVLKNAGVVAQPFENRVLGRYAEDEGMDWLDSRLRRSRMPNSMLSEESAYAAR